MKIAAQAIGHAVLGICGQRRFDVRNDGMILVEFHGEIIFGVIEADILNHFSNQIQIVR